jgi:hypothetical protein
MPRRCRPAISAPTASGYVATTGSLRGRIGIVNARFQDPTYIAPSVVDVSVMDTATGAARKVFPDKRHVRGFKWSPDSSRLALFVLNIDKYEPVLWERASATVHAVAPPAGREAAENAEFEWSRDGSELAAYDVATAGTREVVPESRVSSYSLLEDSLALTYAEDVTRKTDYDVIFGVDNEVKTVPAQGPSDLPLMHKQFVPWTRTQRALSGLLARRPWRRPLRHGHAPTRRVFNLH